MERIHKDLEFKRFEMPSSITKATVCIDSGLVPLAETCEFCLKGNAIYEEYFANGTVPTATCDHHVALDICSETGKIANANCPEAGIEKKVFIVGADPTTYDKSYIASEEFLATICTHQATNVPETNIPEIQAPEIVNPNNLTLPNNSESEEADSENGISENAEDSGDSNDPDDSAEEEPDVQIGNNNENDLFDLFLNFGN
jgi:penicillin-binding protein 1A